MNRAAVFLLLLPEWRWSSSWVGMGVPSQMRTGRIRTLAPSWTSASQVRVEGRVLRSAMPGYASLPATCCQKQWRQNNGRGVGRMKRMSIQKKRRWKSVIHAHPQLKDNFLFSVQGFCRNDWLTKSAADETRNGSLIWKVALIKWS